MKNALARPFPAALLAIALLSSPSAPAEEVYLVRGGLEIFSLGMNQMAAQLQAKGVNATVHSIVEWKAIANGIVKRSREKKVSYPIIFLGHSLGADAAAEFANHLGENGIPVELVLGLGSCNPSGSPRKNRNAGGLACFPR